MWKNIWIIQSCSFENKNLGFKVNYTDTHFGNFKLLGQYSEGFADYDSRFSPADSTIERGDFKNYQLSAGWNKDYKNQTHSLDIAFATDDSDNRYVDFSQGPTTSTFVTKRSQIDYNGQYRLNDTLNISGGINWYNDDVSQSSTTFEVQERDVLAVFVGAYYDADELLANLTVRQDDDEQFGNETTYTAAAGYHLSEDATFRISQSTGFKAPTFNDLYYPASQWGDSANPNLTPEESLNYEIALDVNPSLADFRIAFYQNEISDLISRSSSTGKNENIAKAEIKGIELVGEFATGALFHSASIDVMDTENKATGKELARRSKYSAKWNVSYTYYDWNFDLSYLYRGESYDDTANNTKLDAYSLVDFSTHYYITDNLIARGKIANLFDEDYETSYGYNTQERSYYAGLNYKF